MHRVVAALLALVGWLVVGLAAAAPAAAHAELVSATPAPGSQLDEPPGRVVLRFTETVSPVSDRVRLLAADGEPAPIGEVRADGAQVIVPVDAELPDGGYLLVYRVISADGHPVAGTVPFAVGDADTAAVTRLAETQNTTGDAGDDPIFVVVRWVGFAGVVLGLGPAVFVALCWPAGAADRRVRTIGRLGLGAVAAGAMAAVPLQASYVSGRAVGELSGGDLTDVLGADFGEAVLARVALAVAGLVVLPAALRRRGGAGVLGVAIAVGLLGTYAWSGHPAATGHPALTMTADGLHLAAAAAWLGGLVVLVVRVLPAPGVDDVAGVLRRWSTLAAAGVGVLVVTGVFQAWFQLPSLDAVVDTGYGRWLLAKSGGLIVLVGLGALGRGLVRRRVPPAARAQPVGASVGAMVAGARPAAALSLRRLRRSVLAEVALGAAVLAASAVLVATPPGGGTAAGTGGPPPGPVTRRIELPNDVRAELTVDPPVAGRPTVRLRTVTPDGVPTEPEEVTVTAALPQRSIPAVPLRLRRDGPGRYVAEAADLPLPGRWRLTVTVRTSQFDSGVGTAEVTLR